MLRLFVALELPNELKHEIALLSGKLNKDIKNAKWVPEKNIHLTLKFLGQCEDEMPLEIESSLKNLTKKFNRFSFKLSGLEAFPSIKRARVLCVGVNEGRENIISLQHFIEESLYKVGFAKDEREFSPHITFARLKNPCNIERFLTKMDTRGFSKRFVEVNSVNLFRSHLMSSGPIYEKILEIKLKDD